MEVDSKQYSWAWVTGDRLLSHGACELLCAFLTPDGTAADVTLYDGENTNGDKIIKFTSPNNPTRAFSPKVPVYCRRGLYVDVGSNVTGIFVQWRELGHKGS